MMDDLRRRFTALDDVPVPDVWSDVERRLQGLGTPGSMGRLVGVKSGRRAPVADPSSRRLRHRRHDAALLAAALLIALVVGGAVAVGSGLVRLSSVVPPVSLPSPAVTPVPSSVGPSPSLTRADTSSPTGWSAAGTMTKAREYHTATLLADGRVLVAGGSICCAPLADGELYDPRTRAWTVTGSLATARRSHTASLLADGRVLVVGGLPDNWDPAKPRDSAELYDPTSGTWSATRPMVTARNSQTATVLADGRVLIAGGTAATTGSAQDRSLLDTAEIFDPRTGAWAATGQMSVARAAHLAVLLADGRVLVVGGNNGSRSLASAELYDPTTGTWSATGGTSIGSVYTATVLPDGTVLATGGARDQSVGDAAELYDPSSGTWGPTGSLTVTRGQYTATRLADGRVMVTGGVGAGSDTVASAEIYHPDTGVWAAAGSMATSRSGHTAVALADGQVLVAGGVFLQPRQYLASAEVYDPGPGH
jgi:hypothetical protein